MFTGSYNWYLLWAFVQHMGVIGAVWFWPMNTGWKFLISVILFGIIYHLKNYKLMAVTTSGGLVMYGLFGLGMEQYGWISAWMWLAFIPLHALTGRLLMKAGWEMRVWFNNPNW